MWLQKWIWGRYKELRLKIGINIAFTFEKAKEILSYDSNETIYKLLNELEKSNIIKVDRLKKDRREKRYKIVLDLKDIPYLYINIPSDYKPKQEFLASTGSMAVQGTITVKSPSREFNKIYNKESEQFVTIVPEKEALTIEDYLIKLIKEYKTPEAILSIIKKHRIDFSKVIVEEFKKHLKKCKSIKPFNDKCKRILDKEYFYSLPKGLITNESFDLMKYKAITRRVEEIRSVIRK